MVAGRKRRERHEWRGKGNWKKCWSRRI